MELLADDHHEAASTRLQARPSPHQPHQPHQPSPIPPTLTPTLTHPDPDEATRLQAGSFQPSPNPTPHPPPHPQNPHPYPEP
eukprot:2245143-Prymnesium_polylepis.1